MLWWTLRKLKSEDSDRRIAAVEELADSEDPRAIPPLVAALRDRDSNMRRAAAEALGAIGDARAVEPLVAALRDRDSDVRQAAAKALNALGWEPANDTQRAERAVASQEWGEAVSLGPAAVEPLVAVLRDKDWSVWAAAAEALEKIRGAQAADPL